MRLSFRRVAVFASISLFAACSSSNDAPAPANVPDSGAPDTDVPDTDVPDTDVTDTDAPDTDVPDTDVLVTFVDRYGFVTGEATDVVRTTNDLVSASAIVTIDGVTKTIAGEKRADGSIVIPDVPKAPYVLELRRSSSRAGDPPLVVQYPMEGARRVRLGVDFWARHDAPALADAAKLGLDLTVPEGVVDSDTFSWIGLRSYFYRSTTYYAPDPEPYDGHVNQPEDGATSTPGWTIEARVLDAPYGPEASGLPSAAAGDDLRLLQERVVRVTREGAPFDPWRAFNKYETIGVLDAGAVTFTNEATNTVSGTLVAPAKEALSLELRGSMFATIRDTAGYPKNARASASISMVQEAGAGPQLYVSVAPTSWTLAASSKPKPLFDECFPGTTTCDPLACPVDCLSATDGLQDPGDLSYAFDAPRVFTTGMRDFYDVSYAYSLSWANAEGDVATLSATSSVFRPKAGASASFELELDAVSDLRVDGKSLSWDALDTLPAGTAPVVSFEPPAVGTPEYYEVSVVELFPDHGADVDAPRSARTVATLHTRATSIAIPPGVLRSGRHYYLRVYARRDGRDFTAPHLVSTDTSIVTGIFSPVFTVAEP